MKKRTITFLVIPLLFALAIVGTGFSAFIFDESNSLSMDASIEVEPTINGNEIISYANKVKIWFSQKRVGDSTSYDFKFTYEEDTSIVRPADRKVSEVEFRPVYVPEGQTARFKFINLQIHLKEELAEYFPNYLGENGVYTKPGVNTNIMKYPSTESGMWVIWLGRSSSKNDLDIFDWEFLKFTYNDDKRPQNINEYNTLKNLVTLYGNQTKIIFNSKVTTN